MSAAPTQVWIKTAGGEPKDWVAGFMSTGKIEADSTFDIDTPDGPTKVNVGDAVFVLNGHAYVCPPRLMHEKLRSLVPEEVAVVSLAPMKARAPARPAPKFKAVIGAPCTPANIEISKLNIDDSYQRSIEGGASQKAIEKIAANWDWRLCLPLLGSRRKDGKIYIIDGQHRKEAADLRGDIPWLPVVIFDLDDQKQEAELFVAANRARRPMSNIDDFHAAIVAGDKKAAAINDAIHDSGLRATRNSGWQQLQPGEVMFIRAVDRALKNYGREITVAALGTVAKAFDGQTLIGGGSIFDGLVCLVGQGEKTGKPIDLDLMQIVLAEVGLPGWKDAIANVDGGTERNEVMQRALRAAYDEAGAE